MFTRVVLRSLAGVPSVVLPSTTQATNIYACCCRNVPSNCGPRLLSEQFIRSYAKGKDKKKEAKGKKKIEINQALLSEVLDFDKLKKDMESNLDKLNENFQKHLSLRSTTGSLEQLPVTVDGKKYPLIELGQVIRNNPKTIVINMISSPQAIPAVLAALEESGMNLSPQQDGTTVYVPIPRVTTEHREMLSKNAKALFIKCRDGIRDVQTKSLKKLKLKEKEGLSIDDVHRLTDYVKCTADEYIAQADKMLVSKQNELLGTVKK